MSLGAKNITFLGRPAWENEIYVRYKGRPRDILPKIIPYGITGIKIERKIRDSTNSYPICLHSQTFLIMLCVVAWSIEYCILYCRTRTGESEKSDTDTTNT
ncbi:hypothetical protein YQE_01347, partial [Dendroctonus ponderosae]